jgi:hypothetical protein
MAALLPGAGAVMGLAVMGLCEVDEMPAGSAALLLCGGTRAAKIGGVGLQTGDRIQCGGCQPA